MSEKNLILKVEYDGTNYSGWQIQPNANTIQEELGKALRRITVFNSNIIASGRTDAGVHAFGQIANVRLENDFNIEDTSIPRALNSLLPADIRIVRARVVNNKFHSRFDALKREYVYRVATQDSVFTRLYTTEIRYDFDPDRLFKAAEFFRQMNDFTTFSKINPDITNPVCDIDISEWKLCENGIYEYRVRANHFLYGMVRLMVGAMMDVARGKTTLFELEDALKLRDRSLASPSVPAKGLFFVKAYYPEGLLEKDF